MEIHTAIPKCASVVAPHSEDQTVTENWHAIVAEVAIGRRYRDLVETLGADGP